MRSLRLDLVIVKSVLLYVLYLFAVNINVQLLSLVFNLI